MIIRTLLVDDEEKALLLLEDKLSKSCPNIEVIGKTSDPDEAKNFIEEEHPQLVFLDIAMPQKSGFDVLNELTYLDFELIFVTAFDQYAIEAIEHAAIGYLLKPVDNAKLIKAVEIAEENIATRQSLSKNELLLNNLSSPDGASKKMVIPIAGGFQMVEIQDIKHIKGDDGYTHLIMSDDSILLSSYRIGHFAKVLANHGFYATHRSHIINLKHIIKYLNEGYVILSSGDQIPVSRNRRKELIYLLHEAL